MKVAYLKQQTVVLSVMLLGLAGAVRMDASLTVFQQFNGNVGLSTDGWGSSIASSGTISASVPVGSAVLGAYLYSSYSNNSTGTGTVTLNGTAVALGAVVAQTPSCCGLAMRRGDVTSIVAPIINGGLGGVYDFTVTESSTGTQDGEALVVVYSNPTLGTGSVGILDGFSISSGDSTSVNFLNPLNTAAPGFQAEMRLGIGFSTGDSQVSTVTVNGTVITNNAGGFDDGNLANGGLFTMGGFDDPFSTLLPTSANDHERYNLIGQIANGSSTITVNTRNPSGDDNILLAAFLVSGEAGFNQPPPSSGVPEPCTYTFMASGLLGLYAVRRRMASKK